MQKIEKDAAVAMVRMLTDHKLYQTMMGRETNFRYSDIFRDIQSAKVVEIHSVFSLWRQMGGFSPILLNFTKFSDLYYISRKLRKSEKFTQKCTFC